MAELARCEQHGLAYDPATRSGCVLCRRRTPSRFSAAFARRQALALLALGLAGLGVLGFIAFKIYGMLEQPFREALEAQQAQTPPPPAPSANALGALPPLPPAPEELPPLGRSGNGPHGYPRDQVDKLGLLALLHERRFAELTDYIESLQNEFAQDFLKEYWASDAVLAFDTAHPEVITDIDRWVAHQPKSYAPLLARAASRIGIGWYYRGGKWARETHASRLKKFEEHLRLADQDLIAALNMNPKLVVALQLRIRIATSIKTTTPERETLDRALRLCPNCFRIRGQFMLGLQPRWGGSYEAMDAFATESQKHSSRNPRLRALLGYADLDRCDVHRRADRFDDAVKACDRALAAADLPIFHHERAQTLVQMKRYDEALAALDRALDGSPQEVAFLRDRGRLNVRMKRYGDGARDLRIARLLDPTLSSVQRDVDYAIKKLVAHGYDRHMAGDLKGAIQAYDWALSLDPAHADATRRRAHAELAQSKPAGTPENPKDFASVKAFDDVMAQRGEFGVIVAAWDRYLASDPGNARAYLERGGAHLHAGHTPQALADLEKACSMGLADGCKGAQYVRKRSR